MGQDIPFTYLDEEILHELLVGGWVGLHLLSDLGLQLGLELLNNLVYLSHSLDTTSVLLLGSLNLETDFLVVQLVLEVLGDLELLLSDVVVLLNDELGVGGLLDGCNLLFSVLLDEADHGVQDLLGLDFVHFISFF